MNKFQLQIPAVIHKKLPWLKFVKSLFPSVHVQPEKVISMVGHIKHEIQF